MAAAALLGVPALVGGSQGDKSSAPVAKPALLCPGAVCLCPSAGGQQGWEGVSQPAPASSSVAPAGTGRWWQQEQLRAGSAVPPLSTLDPAPALFIYV